MKNQRESNQITSYYDFLDSIIRLPIDSSEINHNIKYLSILDHEYAHFFQHYYTNVGISQLAVIRIMNILIDDLLFLYKPNISIPLINWVPSTRLFRENDSVVIYHDRILKLRKQLDSAYVSQQQINIQKERLTSINIQELVKGKGITIDLKTRNLQFWDQPIFTIDISAICESMAFAIEQLSRAVRLSGVSPNQKAGVEGQHRIEENLIHSLNDVLVDPTIINYTFPILMLLQSGYQYSESVQLIVLAGYLALMSQISVPSLPELGVNQDVKLGSVASRNFVNILLNICNDELLPIINKFGSNDRVRFITYADAILEYVQLPSLEDAFDGLKNLTSPDFIGHNNMSKLENDWFKETMANVYSYNDFLSKCNTPDGINSIMTISRYFADPSIGPMVICKDGYVHSGEHDPMKRNKTDTYHFGLNIRRYIAFDGLSQNYGYSVSKEEGKKIEKSTKNFLNTSFGIDQINEESI